MIYFPQSQAAKTQNPEAIFRRVASGLRKPKRSTGGIATKEARTDWRR